MPPSTRVLMATEPVIARRIFTGEQAPFTKRATPAPLPAERRGTQGACLYSCAAGHVWMAFLVRAGDTFVLLDPADAFCEEDPCSSAADKVAEGRKISAVRWWVMR